MAAAVDGRQLEGVAQAVERQRAGHADDVAAIDQAAAEAALALGVLVEMHLGGVLPQAGRHHVLGFLDGHAVHMVDLLAHRIVVPQMRAAGQHGVVAGTLETGRHHQIGGGDRAGQLGHTLLGDGGAFVALLHHHPADVIHHHLAALVAAHRADIDHAGLLVGIFLEADHRGHGGDGVARIDRHAKAAAGIAQIGNGIERHVGHGLAEHHVEGGQIVQRRLGQAERAGEFRRGIEGEARAVKRGVKRHVARGHRARGGVADFLAEAEILEEVAGIGLGHGQSSCPLPWRSRGRVGVGAFTC